MDAIRSFSDSPVGVTHGAWRWAALGFLLLALGAAGMALAAPQMAGLAGYALIGGIAIVAILFLLAVWPREGHKTADARRVAEGAGKANVAWAITGVDGAVIDCNPVYRRMAGIGDEESPPPPELALAGEPSAAVLYRLARDAGEGRAREESFQVMPGLEIVAAVRPLADGQAAWWFVPRLAARGDTPPVSVAAPPSQPLAATPAPIVSAPATSPSADELFRDAPMGVAFADASGVILEANKAFAQFFGGIALKGRTLDGVVEAADRAALSARIAQGGLRRR
jgi:two-component system cell cycle sensor histidine kinase/response regulator CckA